MAAGEPPVRATMRAMTEAGLFDDLFAQIDAGGVQLTGEGGFLPEMVKAVLERGLAAELTGHLGYVKGDPAGRGSGNWKAALGALAIAYPDRLTPYLG